MLTAGYWISALLLAAVAVCWAYVLVQPGMLLAPVQAWVRATYRGMPYAKHGIWPAEIDDNWWFKPLWGCSSCCSGQAGFWGYLLLFWPSYSLLAHLGFAAITILFAALWRGLYAWSQTL